MRRGFAAEAADKTAKERIGHPLAQLGVHRLLLGGTRAHVHRADGEEDVADDDKPPAALAGKAKSGKKGDDKEDALIEDPSDLGEDEDDMGEVKEHIDDGISDKP